MNLRECIIKKYTKFFFTSGSFVGKKYFRVYLFAFVLTVVASVMYFAFQDRGKKEILFVGSAPLSGPAKQLGVEYTSGIDTYFRYANETGLIGQDKVVFEAMDDQYEPFLTKMNIAKAIKQKNLYGVLGVVGTPTAEQAVKIALGEGVAFLMPLSGAEFLYGGNPLIFTLRPSYKKEAEAMVRYMQANNIKSAAIVYQNDSFGLTALNALSKSIEGTQVKLVAEGVYNRNTLSINYALTEIIKHSPQAVIIAGTQKPTVELMKKAAENKADTLFFNFSFGGYEPILEEARKKNINLNNVFIAQVVPSLSANGSEDAKLFLDLYPKYHPNSKPNSIAFEGFLAAKIIISALGQDRDSREGFIKALSAINVELAGKKLSYLHDHNGLKNTYLLRLTDTGGVAIDE